MSDLHQRWQQFCYLWAAVWLFLGVFVMWPLLFLFVGSLLMTFAPIGVNRRSRAEELSKDYWRTDLHRPWK